MITSIPSDHGVINEEYCYQTETEDKNHDTLSYSIDPNYMSIESNGLFCWTPPAGGTYNVTITVGDGHGGTDTQNFAIGVTHPPVLGLAPNSLHFDPNDTSKSLSITNTGEGLLNWSLSVERYGDWEVHGDLVISDPNGSATTETDTITVTVDRTGLSIGTYQGTISIESNGGDQNIPVTLLVPNYAPVITSTASDHGVVNEEYCYQVEAEDKNHDTLSYSIDPNYMSIDPNGLLCWTPASEGTYDVAVTVSDGHGGTDTQDFSIDVTHHPVLGVDPDSLDFDPNDTLKLLSITNTGGGTLNWSLSVERYGDWAAHGDLIISDPNGNTTTETDIIAIEVDRAGLIHGTYEGLIKIESDGGDQNIPVSMLVPNHPPVIEDPSCITTLEINEEYTCQIEADDADGDILKYSLTISPDSNMIIYPNTGLISWTPTEEDTYMVTVTVKDEDEQGNELGGEATLEFELRVIQGAVTVEPGTLDCDTTWTYECGLYMVPGPIEVSAGCTLTIEPGVEVRFFSSGVTPVLEINGTLVARGTEAKKIKFTGTNWGYILFTDSSTDAEYLDGTDILIDGSVLEHCIVQNAGGLDIDNIGAVMINKAHPFINYCIIEDNSSPDEDRTSRGIHAWDLTQLLKIANSTIRNNEGAGIETSGGQIIITDSAITDNDGDAGIETSSDQVTITDSTITGNKHGIKIYSASAGFISNSEIKGNTNTGIYMSGSSNITITENLITKNSGSGICVNYNSSATITDNNITYNAEGVYTKYRSKATITNNTITNNTSSGIYIDDSGSTINHNVICNNATSWEGGGIFIEPRYDCTITNNIITNNTASNGGGVRTTEKYGDITIAYNVIADNNSSDQGGGIQTKIGKIVNNSIIRNSAQNGSGLYYSNGDDKDITCNTITGNKAIGFPRHTIYMVSYPYFNSNNLFNNSADCELYNGNPWELVNRLDAKNNWWGTTVENEIKNKVFDYWDDTSLSRVDYLPFEESTITACAPISPPINFTAIKEENDNVSLSWSANPEPDTAGYMVYWDAKSGYPYSNSFDVGNETNYTLTDLTSGAHCITITAYDNGYLPANDNPDTLVNENQTNGNESWYSDAQAVIIE